MKCVFYLLISVVFATSVATSQNIHWAPDGKSYYSVNDNQIVQISMPGLEAKTIVPAVKLTPTGKQNAIEIADFALDSNQKQVLIFTNTQKVWRYNTRGDYWVLNNSTGKLRQVGKALPAASLMFAKFSPNGKKIAFVSNYNLFVEDAETGKLQQLTTDGNRKLINGTFDWAYEEEFFCRDGFRWSPDSKQIAYWQIDAKKVKEYLMINNTDSIYPIIQPVEYPSAGEAPSPFKIGVVQVSTGKTNWMNIPTDPVLQSYLPRMEWAANSSELIVQHLNRLQNQSDLLLCNVATQNATTIYSEKDAAWIDILPSWDEDYSYGGWDWLNNGKEFVWASEKDGWRHLYRVSCDGKSETLITTGDYDVIDICAIDQVSGLVYFIASPGNATEKYLYRTALSGKGRAERMSPANQNGTHIYNMSPTGSFASHTFSNYYTPYVTEWVSIPDHKALGNTSVAGVVAKADPSSKNVEFFKITTADAVTMDAFMVKPTNFDSTKKYPVVFYVYTEPAGQNVVNRWGVEKNRLYNGNMVADGYIYISIDNRGTPAPKGAAWRKSIYRKIGRLNIKDQAMAATEILKYPFVDKDRVAVWGWSGGGSATLNLMFQYPDIYKTGISIAAVGNQLTYDNIYQERYMGIPQQNRQDFVDGSPITYAKNLKGNLLYIHGTGDDNVHYNNAEMLVNELIKYNRQFQFMPYPNRTHSISEGEGTFRHLSTLFTTYLKQHCPPGAK